MPRRTAPDPAKDAPAARRLRGFERAGALVEARIRGAGERRGFATARLLTHWTEIVGEEIARLCRPLKVTWSQGGFGGTLILQADGAVAPLVQMEEPRIRERVNACHGHAAIARIRIQQGPTAVATARPGFAEAQSTFASPGPAAPSAAVATGLAAISDPELRAQLAALAGRVRRTP
jgi:hypothetical protein